MKSVEMSSLSVTAVEVFGKGIESKVAITDQLTRQRVKKKQPKLKPPDALGRIFTSKDRYFTAGSQINESNQRNIHAEALPFKYPQDLEEFSYRVMSRAWRETRTRKEMKLKYNERPSYRTRQKLDLLKRLWVKEPGVKSMKTILDLDSEFFTVVEGRPVKQKFNRWDYIADVRDVLRTKIMTGFREDEIMLIEENFIQEQKIIDRIKSEFQKYVNTFEDFLFNDHTHSMALLRKSELAAGKAAEKYETYRELSKKYGSLKSIVYNLEEKWRNCKMYQKFLYLVSPMEWRKIYDFYHINILGEETELQEERADSSVFSRYRLSVSGEVLSLENLIDQFIDDVKIQYEPALYFTEPTQLLKVFSFIEVQNLNTLLHSEELAAPLEHVHDGMLKIHRKFDEDMATLQEIIDSLEGGIIWEEHRAKYLEELALELINGDFKELISNEQAINMYVFVEDVYESRIASNDSNLGMADMMKIIEMTYRDYLLTLDRLPEDIVYMAEMTCYKEEARMMTVAKEAAKKVVQVERLMKHLARLLEPPIFRAERSLKWRSPPLEPPSRPTPPPKPLTDEESEYLTFFVDYCSHTDDYRDFGIRVHKKEKEQEKEQGKTDDI